MLNKLAHKNPASAGMLGAATIGCAMRSTIVIGKSTGIEITMAHMITKKALNPRLTKVAPAMFAFAESSIAIAIKT